MSIGVDPSQLTRESHNRSRKHRRFTGWRYAGTVLLFLLPSAIPLTLFTFYPMIRALWTSFHEWNLLGDMTWVGLANYTSLLSDPSAQAAFLHTFEYLVGYLPLVYIGGLAAALALNTQLAGRNFFRSIYFLPVVTSWIAVALVWRWLLQPSNGLVNTVLSWFGISGPGWYTDPNWAMPSVILASVWKDIGFVMVILLSGLQAIPAEIEEAALLDGAGRWRKLMSITLPMLSPTTFFVVVISLINGFQVFDQVYAMTGGGPANSSEVIVQHIYNLTFRYGEAGSASALSMILFVVILAVTAIQIRGQKKWVYYA